MAVLCDINHGRRRIETREVKRSLQHYHDKRIYEVERENAPPTWKERVERKKGNNIFM
jgi:hypothetical protein